MTAPARGRGWARRVLRPLVLLALAGFLGLWSWSAGVNGVRAAQHLLHGKSAAENAKRETSASQIESGPLLTHLAQAGGDFSRARAELNAPAVRALNWVPVLGRQIRSARALAGAGATVASAATDAVTQLRGDLRAVPADGNARLTRLRQFLAVAHQAQTRVDHVSLGPQVGLIRPLATAHNELLDGLVKAREGLDRGVAATQGVVDLLSGHHQVLVLITSNSETRAEAGVAEDLGTLAVDDGRLRFTDHGSSGLYPVAPGAVPATGDLAALWGWTKPTQFFQDLLYTPRFDVAGPLAARMWAAAGQTPVDAVLAVDPVFLQDVLQVTGPVPGPRGPINADNVLPELLHNQYLAFPAESDQKLRKQELGTIAGEVFDHLNAGGFSLLRMGLGTASASRGRHVLVWSSSPADESGWVRAGAAGELTAQSLGVSIDNRGGNKLDWFLSSDATLTLRSAGNDTEAEVVVHLHNAATPGEPLEIDGPSQGIQGNLLPGQPVPGPGDYLGMISLSLPGSATDVRILDHPPPNVAGPDGPSQVVAGQYEIPRGQDFTLTVSFRLPGRHGSINLEPSARVPQLLWHVGSVTLDSSQIHLLQW